MPRSASSFMNGVPELLILGLLQSREMYGYELVQKIRSETNAVINLGEGVIYPALHALEKQRALKSRRKEIDGRTRVYYSLTPSGAKRLTTLSAQWSRVTGAVNDLMREAPSATPTV